MQPLRCQFSCQLSSNEGFSLGSLITNTLFQRLTKGDFFAYRKAQSTARDFTGVRNYLWMEKGWQISLAPSSITNDFRLAST